MSKAHISLSGLIGMGPESFMGEPFFTSDDVRNLINENKSATQLIVHITTRGGDVDESFTIHELLTHCGKKVTTVAEGKVASGGTIILLAGAVRQITKYSEIMIHNPWGGVQGDADQLQRAADEMQRTEDRIAQFYADKTGQTTKSFDQWMKEEKYMNAEEAMALGFVTEIIEPMKAVALLHSTNQKTFFDMKPVIEQMKSAFAEFKSDIKAMISGEEKPKALDLTLADGRAIHIETESENYKEGDVVAVEGESAKDGEYVFPDGTIINVASGKINTIKKKEEDANPDEAMNALKAENEALKLQVSDQEKAMNEIVNEFKAVKTEMKTEITDMRKHLQSGYKPKARTTDFKRAKGEQSEERNRAEEAREREKEYKSKQNGTK